MEQSKKNTGFTLIELVIVIAVLSIIFAVVIVITWPAKSIDLNAISYQIISDIRYTQALSMAYNQRFRVNFATNSYSIADHNGTLIKHPAANSTIISLGSGINFSKPPTPNCMAFNGQGIPCNCNSGAQLNNEIIKLATANAMRDITVTAITGYVSVGP